MIYASNFFHCWRGVMTRVINILFALDCFLFAVATLGKSYPSESFSSAAYRAEKLGMFYGRARKWIDRGFSIFGQVNHCQMAYDHAKLNLPEDER
jgi:hypothetical protein